MLNGESPAPDGATPEQYALYLLLSAVEDLAKYFQRTAP